jgi:hypothetical protein
MLFTALHQPDAIPSGYPLFYLLRDPDYSVVLIPSKILGAAMMEVICLLTRSSAPTAASTVMTTHRNKTMKYWYVKASLRDIIFMQTG